jgi:hypothetical protein
MRAVFPELDRLGTFRARLAGAASGLAVRADACVAPVAYES